MFSRAELTLVILVLCISICDFRDVNDIRKKFLKRLKQNKVIKDRTNILDKGTDNVEYLDGIAHYKINKNEKNKWKIVRRIENDFRRLIAMEGVTYNYKRDVSWRTWRIVTYPGHNSTIVCYKCNGVTRNCKMCDGGFWTIEENPPPCPYEFYSLINDDVLCGANYTQYKDVKSSCPSRIKFSELSATCDNPIETTWRFTRVFNCSKKYENIICNGRDYCEIFTVYTISPQNVTFRIINSSNDILYSRIMKAGNNNYICAEDCGIYNTITKRVNKNENPVKIDLLSKSTVKKKRENLIPYFTAETIKNFHVMSKNGEKKITRNNIRNYRERKYLRKVVERSTVKITENYEIKSTTKSHCKQIEDMAKYEDLDIEDYDESQIY